MATLSIGNHKHEQTYILTCMQTHTHCIAVLQKWNDFELRLKKYFFALNSTFVKDTCIRIQLWSLEPGFIQDYNMFAIGFESCAYLY